MISENDIKKIDIPDFIVKYARSIGEKFVKAKTPSQFRHVEERGDTVNEDAFVGCMAHYAYLRHMHGPEGIGKLFDAYWVSNHFPEIRQIRKTQNDIVFALPLMLLSFKQLMSEIKYLPYKIYCIKCRFFDTSRNLKILYKDKTIIEKIFKVMADSQTDIYNLYGINDKNDKNDKIEFIGNAYIPNYEISCLLNNIFRNIKENKNLDAIEESDDEDDFENDDENKYVDLNKYVLMQCEYNEKSKKWVPKKIVPNNSQISTISNIFLSK